MDAETNGIANGLSNCMTRDGQSPATANIPMGNNKLTGLAPGTLSTDATNLGQLGAYMPLGGGTFTGSVAGVTPAETDNSTLLATTAMVRALGVAYQASAVIALGTNTTITLAQLGGLAQFQAASVTATLPPVATTTQGQTITFLGGAYGGTIAGNAAETITSAIGATANTVTAAVGETVTITSNGTGWFASSAIAVAALPGQGGALSRLKISTVGATNYTSVVTANSVALSNAAGSAFLVRSVNVSPVMTASGANGLDTGAVAAATWYYVFVIYNPTTSTVAGLFSLSSTAPTLPAGYTFFARVGTVRTDASANKYLIQMLQYGKEVQYIVPSGGYLPQIISGATGSVSTPTYTAYSLTTLVPPTASKVIAQLFPGLSASGTAIVAPNANYGPFNGYPNGPFASLDRTSTQTGPTLPFSMLLESMNIYYASSSGNNLACIGWEDNL